MNLTRVRRVPGLRADSIAAGPERHRRAVRGIVALVAATIVLATVASASGATLNGAWVAKVGTSGVNGTVTVYTYTTGTGQVLFNLKALARSTYYAAGIYKGTCTTLGSRIVLLPTYRTTSTGTLVKNITLSTTATTAVRAATKGTGRMSVVLGSGSLRKCRIFSAIPYATATPTPSPCGPPSLCPGQALLLDRFSVTALSSEIWTGTTTIVPHAGYIFVTVKVSLAIRDDVVLAPIYFANLLVPRVRTAALVWYDRKPGEGRTPDYRDTWIAKGVPYEVWFTFEVPTSVAGQLWFSPVYGFEYRLF